jgi:MYXO-CTERM domain-containing protein
VTRWLLAAALLLATAAGARGDPLHRQRRTRFAAGAAGFARGLWDLDTGVPLQLVGSAIPIPPRAAHRFLARHVDLLAPGSRPDDLTLLADRTGRGGVRTISFAQRAGGLPVLGARVSLRFRGDHLVAVTSTALPHPVAARPARPVRAGPVVVVPRVDRRGVSYRTAIAAEAGTGFARETIWLDAATGEVIARAPLFRQGSGTVRYDTPVRWPGGERADHPAAFADLVIDGAAGATDADGAITWPGAADATITTGVSGATATVIDAAEAPASATLTLPDGGGVTWSAATDELADAQLTTFIHLVRAKEYARGIDPELPWLDETIEATVNIDGFCNAFSDGSNVFFFRANRFCSNTGRLPDAVYHEFGHSLHQHALIDGAVDPALGEGAADYLAATITGDPGVARGFYLTAEPLRQIDPDGFEYVWPNDIDATDPHLTGRIVSGALWDLRSALVAELGAEDGVALADRLYYEALRHAVDIPSTYLEILLADDDDGDLEDGTPHRCAIDTAFARHGLADPDATGAVGSPEVTGLEVFIPVTPPATACPSLEVAQVRLRWRRRGDTALGDPIDMAPTAGGFRAAIPDVPPGTALDYQIEVVRASGTSELRPNNPADPTYQLFHGETEPIYCTGFRDPPSADGWASGAHPSGPDEWMWGQPWGAAGTGDPARGFSGTTVYGTDLGGIDGDGRYPPAQVSYTDMPEVAVPTGVDQVRLQYRRWLTVEDANFDVAAISVNGGLAWQNAASGGTSVHHIDREWRFHDVDISDKVVEGRVAVRFEIAADEELELGGWNLDDVCLVTFTAPEAGGADAGPDESALVDDGGCGCRAAGATSPTPWLAAALVLAGQLRRRRRRVTRQRA